MKPKLEIFTYDTDKITYIYNVRIRRNKPLIETCCDPIIRERANVLIFKTYSAFLLEICKRPALLKGKFRITVTGADQFNGIEKKRETVRSEYGDRPNVSMTGRKNQFLSYEEDEEKFVRLLLDRLQAQRPMTLMDMRLAVKEIEVARRGDADAELPSEAWVRQFRMRYRPIFFSERITVKYEVLDGTEQKEESKDTPSKRKKKSPAKKKHKKIKKSRVKLAAHQISFDSPFTKITFLQKPKAGASSVPKTNVKHPAYRSIINNHGQWTEVSHSSQIVQPGTKIKIPQELKYNFCRFCMASTNKTGECNIPDEFLRVFHHFYGQELEELENFPHKICVPCHDQFSSFVAYLQTVLDAQPKIKDFVSGRNLRINIERSSITESLKIQHQSIEMLSDPLQNLEVIIKTEPEEEVSIVNTDDNGAGIVVEPEPELSLMDAQDESESNDEFKPFNHSKVKTDFDQLKDSEMNISTSDAFSCKDFFSPKIFLCDLCGYSCKTRDTLKNHIEVKHLKKQKTSFPCGTCKLTFDSRYKRWKHRQKVHSHKVYKCDLCDFTGMSSEAVAKHKKAHHAPKIACTLCGDLVCEPMMRIHIERKHAPSMCCHCGKEFEGKHQMQHHVRSVHETNEKACPVCNVVFQNHAKVKIHQRLQHDTTIKFNCLVEGCSYSSNRRSYTKLHLSHHRDISDALKKELIDKLQTMTTRSMRKLLKS